MNENIINETKNSAESNFIPDDSIQEPVEEIKKEMRRCTCTVCGKEFRSPGVNRYCSPECREKERGKTSYSVFVCKNCGKEFTGYKNAKFYSDSCRIYFKNRAAAERKLQKRNEELTGTDGIDFVTCQICGCKAVMLNDGHFKAFHDMDISKYRSLYPKAQITCSKHIDDHFKGSNNPASIERTTEQERKERSPYSEEFYKSRDIPVEKRDELIKKINEYRESTTSLDYYLNKGYDEYTAKKMLAERQRTFTLKKCIEKYGEEEGTKKFNERQEKWAAKMKELYEAGTYDKTPHSANSNIYSMFEIKCTDDLIYKMNLCIDEFHGVMSDSGQLRLRNERTHRTYLYDFEYNGKIIEFNGDYWHMNPAKYDPNFYHARMHCTAKDVEKVKLAEGMGYKVMTLWESEYNDDPEGAMNRCVEFLKS